jgi:hypothetical protein
MPTFVQLTDNENNAGTGVADGDFNVAGAWTAANPVEFRIIETHEGAVTRATLTIVATDVDPVHGSNPVAEQNEVLINGNSLGLLWTGPHGDNAQSTTTFDVPPAWLAEDGRNLIQVRNVNTNNQSYSFSIQSGTLIIDPVSPGRGGASYTITANADNVGNGGATTPDYDIAAHGAWTQANPVEVNLRNTFSGVVNTARLIVSVGDLDANGEQVEVLLNGVVVGQLRTSEHTFFDQAMVTVLTVNPALLQAGNNLVTLRPTTTSRNGTDFRVDQVSLSINGPRRRRSNWSTPGSSTTRKRRAWPPCRTAATSWCGTRSTRTDPAGACTASVSTPPGPGSGPSSV